jgi:hypothetical protein
MLRAIDSVYNEFASKAGLPIAQLEPHPAEAAIVAEAKAQRLIRLRTELTHAMPRTVVTLGNAALRVFRALLDSPVGPTKLVADASYGSSVPVKVEQQDMRWVPLAHPAAPPAYQAAHRDWRPTRE